MVKMFVFIHDMMIEDFMVIIRVIKLMVCLIKWNVFMIPFLLMTKFMINY